VIDGSVSTYVLNDDPESGELELMPVEEALNQGSGVRAVNWAR